MPSLSVCAFGAGAVHILLLALILPVLITLPALDDPTQRTVHVPVAVRTALPAPLASAATSDPDAFSEVLMYGEGDVDEVVLPAAVPLAVARHDLPAQRALAEPGPLIRQASLSGVVQAPAPAAIVAPSVAPGGVSVEDVEVSIVARLPDFMPDVVPYPKRKPDFESLKNAPAAAKWPRPAAKKKARRKPAPAPRRVTKTRPQPQPKTLFGGVFSGSPGGGPGRSMPEFPLPASR